MPSPDQKALYRTGNSVDLRKGSDAEQTDSHAEECEDLSQPAEFSAHTVLNIVKRSADHMSIRFHHAVLDRQKTFRILGRRAKQRRNPHQNKAPGPPATTAVATPTILPVPIVADSAVQSAPKLDTSPSLPSFRLQ